MILVIISEIKKVSLLLIDLGITKSASAPIKLGLN